MRESIKNGLKSEKVKASVRAQIRIWIKNHQIRKGISCMMTVLTMGIYQVVDLEMNPPKMDALYLSLSRQ